MPRKLKDSNLSGRAARSRLKCRRKPYWRLISRGRLIGYRRCKATSGTWIGRYYLDGQRYTEQVLGMADDRLESDGVDILDFATAKAIRKSLELPDQEPEPLAHAPPETVELVAESA